MRSTWSKECESEMRAEEGWWGCWWGVGVGATIKQMNGWQKSAETKIFTQTEKNKGKKMFISFIRTGCSGAGGINNFLGHMRVGGWGAEWKCLQIYFVLVVSCIEGVHFKKVSYAVGKPIIMDSAASSVGSFPSVAFETVSKMVWFPRALSRPFKWRPTMMILEERSMLTPSLRMFSNIASEFECWSEWRWPFVVVLKRGRRRWFARLLFLLSLCPL